MENFLIPIDHGRPKKCTFHSHSERFSFLFYDYPYNIALGLVNPVVKCGTRVDSLFAKNKDV